MCYLVNVSFIKLELLELQGINWYVYRTIVMCMIDTPKRISAP